MSQYENISIAQAKELLDKGLCTVFDIRDNQSYEQGRIPGALRISDQIIRRMRKTEQKHSPVIVYCYHGNSSKDVAQLLCDFGFSDVYSLDGGYTAWEKQEKHASLAANDPSLMPEDTQAWLSENGFDPGDINRKLDNGTTALMHACRYGFARTATVLLTAGADVNLTNNDGNNALWLACFSEDAETLKVLIDNGVDINNKNLTGATALIYASSAGKVQVAKQLLDAGANPHIRTQDDFTALDLAASPQIYHLFRKLEPTA